MNKMLFFALLLIGSAFASVCSSPTIAVCGSDGHDYSNESNATAAGTLVIYCGSCYQYNYYQSMFNTWNASNSNISQYNVTNRSYLERFLSSSAGKLVGDDPEAGKQLLALLIGSFFLVFISFQNMRIEAKMVVIIPATILAAYFVGWLLVVLVLAVGIIIYLALSRLLNK